MNHSKINNTLQSRKNKYLTEKDRYKIEALKKAGVSNIDITKQIGKSDRTIRREIKRGTVIFRNSDWTEEDT